MEWSISSSARSTSRRHGRLEGGDAQAGDLGPIGLRGHPWASALVDSRESSGPARLRYFDWVVGTLRRAGFSLEMAARAFSVLDSYVYGFGRQQLNMSAGGDTELGEATEAFLRAIPADQYPYLREMVVEYAMDSGYDEGADFEFGLNLILDGLERLLDRGAN